jgi:glycerol-3-phosphate dehydrogenase
MVRDLDRLRETQFDLVVVGGGVYGVCAAWRAALNGLTACVLERDDFGGATSSNSLKVIHGGLRYLQHLDLRRMRESIRERSLLMRMAPHLVSPMAFVVPTYGHGVKGREIHRIALRMNDLVAWDRNRGLDPERELPPGRMLSRGEMLERFPGIREDGLTGGALWYDGLSYDSGRLLLAFLESALRAGAAAANYVEATGFIEHDGAVIGVLARDAVTGREIALRSKMVLNAAGPWVDEVLGRLSSSPERRAFHRSKAINLVTRQLFPDVALGLQGPARFRDTDAALDKGFRLFFVVPWRSYSLIGTRHFGSDAEPDTLEVSAAEIETFLAEINAAYPPARLSTTDVVGVYRGMLPRDAGTSATQEVQLEKHPLVIDHEREHGVRGLMTVVGVKWTTARLVAFETVDRICRKLGRAIEGQDGVPPPLAGSPAPDFPRFVEHGLAASPRGLSRESVLHVLRCYGTGSEAVFRIASEDPTLGRPVAEGSPVVAAQIVHGARAEMALHLDDVVFRRTDLGFTSGLSRADLEACAKLMGREAGWGADRQRSEIDRTLESLSRFRSGRRRPVSP